MTNRRKESRHLEAKLVASMTIVLFRPADARRSREFYQQCELLKLPRECTRMGLLTFKQTSSGLVSTGFDHHPGPFDLRVRLRGSRWNQLLAPAAIPGAAEAALRCETLEAIVIERDAVNQKTRIRVANKGKLVLTFCASGPEDGPMTVAQFESDRRHGAAVKNQASIAEVKTALLRLMDAKPVHLLVEARDGVTLLRRADGGDFTESELVEAYRVDYAVVSAAESPASVALRSAIDDADAVGVRKAIRQGAHLQFMPGEMLSPLHWSLLKRKGNWLGCLKELIDAGASVGVGPHQDPALVIGVDISGAKQESTIELIDFLLKQNESIEARGKSAARGGMTPLHVAARNGLLGVVAHLLRRGADVGATTAGGGKKASDLPRLSHTFLADEHRAVRELLLAVERGEIYPAELNSKAIAQQADRMRDGVSDAIADWARSTNSPIAVLFDDRKSEPRHAPR